MGNVEKTTFPIPTTPEFFVGRISNMTHIGTGIPQVVGMENLHKHVKG